MATDKTPSSKHGRLHEEEAARAKSVTFGNLPPRDPNDKSGPTEAFGSQKPFERNVADPIKAPVQKPVEKKPEPERLNGPMLLADVQAALSDRYPHNDIHEMEGATIEVKVPTGVILVDFKAVNKCKNTAELRAYIDALPIQ